MSKHPNKIHSGIWIIPREDKIPKPMLLAIKQFFESDLLAAIQYAEYVKKFSGFKGFDQVYARAKQEIEISKKNIETVNELLSRF